ncbi:hypothetical protein C8R47DRAFT_510166 [Mycena vitilis]|nr:hypothetical protein C8R47DRAFT_510166 [Mycena vitilis]
MQSSTATPDPSSVSTLWPASTLAHSRSSVSDSESSTPPVHPNYHPNLLPSYGSMVIHAHNMRGHLKLRAGKQHLNIPVNPTGDLVGYKEFRERGPPPPGIGQVGDVYLDTAGSVFYARYTGVGDGAPYRSTDPCSASVNPAVGSNGSGEQWRAWRDDSSKPQPLVEHPLYDDRYLWFGGKSGGLGWFASQSLNGRDVGLRSASLSDEDREHLASLVDPAVISAMRRLGQPSPKRKGTALAPAFATKRRRTQSPEHSKVSRPDVRSVGDKQFTEIPNAMEGILSTVRRPLNEARKASDVAQEAANQAREAANRAQEAANRIQEAVQEAQGMVQQAQDTHIPIAKMLVEDEVKRLASAGVEVKELRIDNAKLQTELATKNEAMANMQKLLDSNREKTQLQIFCLKEDVAAKIKAVDNDREGIRKELAAEKQRFRMSTVISALILETDKYFCCSILEDAESESASVRNTQLGTHVWL